MIGNPDFLKYVVSKGIVSDRDFRNLSAKYQKDAFSFLIHMLRKKILKKSELGRLWGDSIGLSYVDLEKTLIQAEVAQKLPREFARKNRMIPIYKFGEAITVAIWNHTDLVALKQAEMLIGGQISTVFAFPDDIDSAIEIQYQSCASLKELTGKIPPEILSGDTDKITQESLEKFAGNQAVVEFVRALLLFGLKEGASDIHIEPGEDAIRIRYRIDGVLQERMKLEISLISPISSRLKILAELNITEKRRPQDGRISISFSNRSIDFRLSTVPTVYGEKIVLRILGQMQKKEVPNLSELFFSNSNLELLKKGIKAPNGIFFVTGPTGSGKSYTLYSALKYINKPEINIMTIEDPVEYRLSGINQVQANPAVKLNFASALRAFLRQDPDVILIGEIRDLETAKIAAEAALTGHLVLATLHTNNSLQAITRLMEIGVEPFLVAPSIIGAMAQRLVRRICDNCKERYQLSPQKIEELFICEKNKEVFFYRGKGCSQCNKTGYSGRIAIHEIFLANDEMRAIITKKGDVSELKNCAIENGFQGLRYDGIKKVLRGITTIDEIDRIAP